MIPGPSVLRAEEGNATRLRFPPCFPLSSSAAAAAHRLAIRHRLPALTSKQVPLVEEDMSRIGAPSPCSTTFECCTHRMRRSGENAPEKGGSRRQVLWPRRQTKIPAPKASSKTKNHHVATPPGIPHPSLGLAALGDPHGSRALACGARTVPAGPIQDFSFRP